MPLALRSSLSALFEGRGLADVAVLCPLRRRHRWIVGDYGSAVGEGLDQMAVGFIYLSCLNYHSY
jgi:hypothetical protein